MSVTILNVKGMSCGGCVNSVKKALSQVETVEEVEVTLATGKVEVKSSGSVNVDELINRVEEIGYEATAE